MNPYSFSFVSPFSCICLSSFYVIYFLYVIIAWTKWCWMRFLLDCLGSFPLFNCSKLGILRHFLYFFLLLFLHVLVPDHQIALKWVSCDWIPLLSHFPVISLLFSIIMTKMYFFGGVSFTFTFTFTFYVNYNVAWVFLHRKQLSLKLWRLLFWLPDPWMPCMFSIC